jgi:iron(III) transport system substrate-binding protein
VETIKAAFLKTFPGIEINFSSATQDVAKARAIQEARAGAISYDFIDTGQNYEDYKAVGITADNTDLLLMAGLPREDIYEGTYSPEYTVYGAAFNTDLVKREELPTTWEGFLEPQWKGRLGVETRLRPLVNGTPFFGGEDKVVEYLRKLKDQNPQFSTGDTRSQTLMVAGEFPVLVGAYLHRLPLHVGQPWGYIHLKEVYSNSRGPGYVVPPRAPHPNAGKLFLWWWCSPEGLKVIDEVRYKGNPAPGTGTGPSRYLEQNGMTVKFAPLEIEQEYPRLERKYVEALGLPIT